MNKSTRLSLLRTRYAALFGVAISGLMPVSAVEVASEARAIAKHRVSDSAIDENGEGEAVASQLSFDPEPKADKDSEILLDASEKRRLNLEVDGFRWSAGKRRGLWLVVV